jgi:hypothetical protein
VSYLEIAKKALTLSKEQQKSAAQGLRTNELDEFNELREGGPARPVDDREVAWRIEAMRPQVPARGPVPFLMANPDVLAHDAPGCCLSCGEEMPDGLRYRCNPCVRAVEMVLRKAREGL